MKQLNEELWEPLWSKRILLHPAEKEILTSTWFKRLAFIHHAGAIFLISDLKFNRQEHTLGVFALVATLEPANIELRIASLLHDLGHYPFSHTLEGIKGIDHHKKTTDILDSKWIKKLMQKYGLNEIAVKNYLSGCVASPLRNQKGIMHLDHLDSWVRAAIARGRLCFSVQELCKQLRVVNGYVETTREIAEQIATLIFDEAEFHCMTPNLGANAIIRHLAGRLLSTGVLTASQLFEWTEEQIVTMLMEHDLTSSTMRKLIESPQLLSSTRDKKSIDAEEVFEAPVSKLYLSLPLVSGKRLDQWSNEIANRLLSLNRKIGKYYIYFEQE